jgi:hypothetical protein
MSTTTTGRAHAADPDKSERMKFVLSVLADGLPHSTAECDGWGRYRAAHSTIHELRQRGYVIPKPTRKAGVYHYRLTARPEPKAEN